MTVVESRETSPQSFRMLLVSSSEELREGVFNSTLSRKLLGKHLWLETVDSLETAILEMRENEVDLVLLDISVLPSGSASVEELKAATSAVLVLLSESEPTDLYETLLGEGLADGYTCLDSLSCVSWGMRLLEMYDHAVQNRRVESLGAVASTLDTFVKSQFQKNLDHRTLLLRAEKFSKR